jgi:hypothetical protein
VAHVRPAEPTILTCTTGRIPIANLPTPELAVVSRLVMAKVTVASKAGTGSRATVSESTRAPQQSRGSTGVSDDDPHSSSSTETLSSRALTLVTNSLMSWTTRSACSPRSKSISLCAFRASHKAFIGSSIR